MQVLSSSTARASSAGGSRSGPKSPSEGAPLIRPEDSLRYVKGIGPRRGAALEEAGLRTVEDFLFHLPFRYEDRSAFLPIAALVPEVRATVRGRVTTAALRRTRRRGFSIFEAVVEDGSGAIRVIFFNQPYLRTLLVRGREAQPPLPIFRIP